ncbi:hypothetical protein KSP40_PGU014196 [Platanthera guangdongensis]|uniref:KIB1-4 beta-propeller domain-containing protein n=1 Tax=Platanthera guangdongensis TaxID=2320717 RepID=A0ABR2LMF7_9ASPA
MASSSIEACWGNLPPEIVLSIAERLVVADIIRLRVICVSWAWALAAKSPHAVNLSFLPSPWLLLPNSDAQEGSNDSTFFSVIEDRCYKISPLPQITGRHLLGTSQHGWLVTIDDLLTPRLLNPLTMQELPLPSLVTIPNLFEPVYFPDDHGSLHAVWYNHTNRFLFSRERFPDLLELYFRKIIVTSSPMQGSIAVVLCTIDIFESCLSFARVGGEAWSAYLKFPSDVDHFEDVIFNEESGKLYALSNLGAVFILECRNSSIEIISMVSMRINRNRSLQRKRYIFFSCGGDLMMVTWNPPATSTPILPFLIDDALIFKIFRFNRDCYSRHESQISNIRAIAANSTEVCPYGSCWMPVNNLGAQSLFIGSNHCIILDCAVENMRNKVFFIYDGIPRVLPYLRDLGMFDLEKSKVKRLLDPLYNLPKKPSPICCFHQTQNGLVVITSRDCVGSDRRSNPEFQSKTDSTESPPPTINRRNLVRNISTWMACNN